MLSRYSDVAIYSKMSAVTHSWHPKLLTAVCLQPRVASADVIQKFNPNNKNALIKQYKAIYHPGEVGPSVACLQGFDRRSFGCLHLNCCISISICIKCCISKAIRTGLRIICIILLDQVLEKATALMFCCTSCAGQQDQRVSTASIYSCHTYRCTRVVCLEHRATA